MSEFILCFIVTICFNGINVESLIKTIFAWIVVKVIEFIIIKLLENGHG